MPHYLCSYLPQNAVYLIVSSFSVQVLLPFSTNQALKFRYQPCWIILKPVYTLTVSPVLSKIKGNNLQSNMGNCVKYIIVCGWTIKDAHLQRLLLHIP